MHFFVGAQSYSYEVLIDDKAVGKMFISKSSYINGVVVLDFNIEFTSGTIGSNKIIQYGTSYYKKGFLTDSDNILERNGRVREDCKVKFNKGKYYIDRKNENQVISEKSISNTLTLMYFLEPKNSNLVFSERYGDFCELKNIGVGIYEVVLPIGGSIRYYYKNGICYKIESKGTLQDLQIKLKAK